jgi:3-hydroxyanthranilate 3,4-dioxygenase
MVVGGPNSRTDFHIDESEEFFYQLEGDINLRIIEDGKPRDLPIREGDIFLLPPRVPHSPQRPAGTVGLVIERKRQPQELDGFAWYCPQCDTKLYEEFLHVSNIVTQLPPVFDRFYGNAEHCTCKKCGFQLKRSGGK